MNFEMQDLRIRSVPFSSIITPAVLLLIIFMAIFAVAIAVILLVLKNKKEQEQTPEWIEAQKKRKTTKNDISVFSEKYKLKPEEISFLWKLCRSYKIPNILYAVKNIENLNHYFERYYAENKNGSEENLNLMFRLKFRIERIFAASQTITSTKVLTKNMHISEIFPDGSKKHFYIYKNEKDFLAIKITEEFFNSDEKPGNLAKVAFTFISETGMRYAFISRLLRYEKEENNFLMLISHSNDLITKQQRNFKRMNIDEKCKIASLKTETNKKNEKIYVPSEQKFDCMLTNISGGGCCISTTLPIKEGQLIYIEFSLENEMVGLNGTIVRTRKASTQGLFNIHVHFINIPIDIQNKILAKVNGYN